MSNREFRVYTGSDVIGAELCGAVKNVIAIACGGAHGAGLGHNTTALLITRGLFEMTKLAIVKGAHPATMTGLAGVGDLLLTCTSVQSRNFTSSRLPLANRTGALLNVFDYAGDLCKVAREGTLRQRDKGCGRDFCARAGERELGIKH